MPAGTGLEFCALQIATSNRTTDKANGVNFTDAPTVQEMRDCSAVFATWRDFLSITKMGRSHDGSRLTLHNRRYAKMRLTKVRQSVNMALDDITPNDIYGIFTSDGTCIARVVESGGAATAWLLDSQGRRTNERRSRQAQHGHSLWSSAPFT